LTVLSRHGRKALEEKPKIAIGTIHSVKGGEADAVILFPDISLAAAENYEKEKDAIIRTFYVGMTRSKQSLYLCKPSSNLSVKFN
jgi:DNA helicase II / ATP-dependent DNA helicase PcrA